MRNTDGVDHKVADLEEPRLSIVCSVVRAEGASRIGA
jgi:hypothetical protein